MRTNLPVTQKEYEFGDGETLVSTTDLQSCITYCNDAFVRTSGIAREELIGQPHSMVRRPDMPQGAFRDMWATLKAGLPWSALVKNRRQDGDHYRLVTVASTKQASGVDQIDIGISQIEGATQQNAALFEQSAASSAVLKQKAGGARAARAPAV